MPDAVIENALINYKDLCVYPSDIEQMTGEYINTLSDPSLIYKASAFTGLLEYIYKHKIKSILQANKQDNNNYNRDYQLLDSIFYNLYVPLCRAYNITPKILTFCSVVGIDNSTLTDLKNGIYRVDGSRVNPATCQIVKKWYTTCESGLFEKAVEENAIGSIFGLKAGYGWQEANTVNIVTNGQDQHESAEQIAARHAQAQLPEKPNLNE